jgi:hypothetical protein
MSRSKIPKEDSRNSSAPSTKNEAEKLWRIHGEEDVSFQRQAQVTWWSVLGGVAVAALLTQLEPMTAAVRNGKWYTTLFFVATCLIMINSWVQTSWATIVLRWPILISTSIGLFFGVVSLSLAALNITRPAIWFTAIFFVAGFGVYNQLFFIKNRSWVTLTPETEKRARSTIKLYCFLLLLLLVGAILLFLYPSAIMEMFWALFALVVSIFALIWQDIGMKLEKKELGVP